MTLMEHPTVSCFKTADNAVMLGMVGVLCGLVGEEHVVAANPNENWGDGWGDLEQFSLRNR